MRRFLLRPNFPSRYHYYVRTISFLCEKLSRYLQPGDVMLLLRAPCLASYIQSLCIGSVVFLRKFNDFAGRRGHVPKWCTARSYESAANALICAKGAMPVSRGLPLIVVYALYYAILLYGRWVFDVLTEDGGCVRFRICTEMHTRIYISGA